ncbi:methyl-accepting chemotaxis protein [Clostridium frigidicarnis]|uniref:Methyl-accepting chemotaxis protein n=1 Tax=Clostridium frigidicarnis TaxID=84698 RepID=A0A1I0WTJ0_9CLOT|nr:methyl-accepting chemotaxis protein [Clostridium frigidicarnis]SFA91273.1 Methyl-accepting chemotaxis protein [Clostridium frigidicarnis]
MKNQVNKIKNKSIKRVLILSVLLITFIILLINTVVTTLLINTNMKEVLIEKAEDQVYEISKQAEFILNSSDNVVEDLQKLVDEKKDQKGIVYAVVINKDEVKAIVHSNKDKLNKTYKDDYTIEGATKGTKQHTRFFAEVEGIWTYDIMRPIYKNGNLYGTMDVGIEESGINSIVTKIVLYQILISIISFIVIGLILGAIIGKIINPLKDLSLLVEKTANLDLSNSEEDNNIVNRKDEIGVMAEALFKMRGIFRDVIAHIKESMENVNDAAENLTAFVEENAASSNEITCSIEEMVKSTEISVSEIDNGMEEEENLSENIESVTKGIHDIVDRTNNMNNLSQRGFTTSMELAKWSEKNKEATNNLNEIIGQVDKSSKEISSIVNIITEIANQTNLLALNASIEAARAGDAGKGFSVVASSIRKLSEQTSSATEDIKKKIEAIQTVSKHAVNEICESIDVAENNIKYSKENNSIFGDIKNVLEEILHMSEEIKTYTNTMKQGKDSLSNTFEQISESVEEISQGSEQILRNSEEQLDSTQEVVGYSETLKALSESLKMEIDKFNL